MNSSTSSTVKSFNEHKKEQSKKIQEKCELIQSLLDSVKKNQKFTKLIIISLKSLSDLISPPNSEIRLNSKIIIDLNGINVLKDIALINIQKEDIVYQIAIIIWKLLNIKQNMIDQELAKNFIEKEGHETVIEILLNKQTGKGCLPLIKILNDLCTVPKLIEKLLKSGLAETIKLVNDLNPNDLNIIYLNFDTIKKVSNQKIGREFLIEKGLVSNILKNIQNCSKFDRNGKVVICGLNVLENLCKNENGKNTIKNENGINIISNVIDVFSNNDYMLKKTAKIFSKIADENDIKMNLDKINSICNKIDDDNILEELRNSLIEISSLMLVPEIGKITLEKNYFDMLKKLFEDFCKIDLSNKKENYINIYETLMKNFMIMFKRIFNMDPKCYDDESEKGKECFDLLKEIYESIKKNWEYVFNYIEKTEKNNEKENNNNINDNCQLVKNGFKTFFSAYSDLLMQHISVKSEKKKEKNFIDLIYYITDNILVNGIKYFDVDEKSNYGASNILKLADDIINNNNENNLKEKVINTFPYIKSVINSSENYKTLSNDLEVCLNLIKNNNENNDIKNELIPIIINFMNDKPKIRYPNYLNLKILDLFLSPEFLSFYFKNSENVIISNIKNIIDSNNNVNNNNNNLNLNLDYINAIVSITVKAFYESSTILKVVEKSDEENNNEDLNIETVENNNINIFAQEEYSNEIENLITSKSSELLKRLISPEEYAKQIKNLKNLSNKYIPGTSNEDILNLENSLMYHLSCMNIKEYFDLGITENINTLKSLILKEIKNIEGFKRIKSKDMVAQKYNEVCESSYKRMRLFLAVVKKYMNFCIEYFNNDKNNEKNIEILKDIIEIDINFIEKSTDCKNLIEDLINVRNNIPFYKDNKESIKINSNNIKKKNIINSNVNNNNNNNNNNSVNEIYLQSLIILFRKNLNDEELIDSIIKTIILLSDKNSNNYNNLVKNGFPRSLLNLMDNTNNQILVEDSSELLKLITLSNEENLKMIANQNILSKLFEIRAKFASNENISRNCNIISNEILKLPGQEQYTKNIIEENMKEFHQNILNTKNNNNNFNIDIKNKSLNNLENINAFTSNEKQIEQLIQNEHFFNDLKDVIDLTCKDPDLTQTIEKLLTNEFSILKKLIENLNNDNNNNDNEINNKHNDITNAVLNCIKTKNNYSDSLLISCKILNDYIKNNNLYTKYINDKINNDFIDTLFEINDNYIDNNNISKEINNILCYLCLLNINLSDYIVKKGGLKNIIDELKSIVNLNDNESVNIKINGLKMLSSLLRNEKNLESFSKVNGVELIEDIIKNEVGILKLKENFDNNNNYTELDEIKYLMTENTINLKDSKDNDNNTSKNDIENNYFIECLKILCLGLNSDKKNFINPKLISNITSIVETKFPNKYLFEEFSNILCNKNVEFNFNNIKLLNFSLSNFAEFYCDKEIKSNVKLILEKLKEIINDNEEYKNLINNSFNKLIEYKNNKNNNIILNTYNKSITFLSLLSELKDINFIDNNINNINNFINDVFDIYKIEIKRINNEMENEINNFNTLKSKEMNFNEGIVISLLKLNNYLFEKNIIDKNKSKDYFNVCIDIGKIFYHPQNYIFVDLYIIEIEKFLKKFGKIIENDNNNNLNDDIKYTDVNLYHLQNNYIKCFPFLIDYQNLIKNSNINDKIKNNNINFILNYILDYYKTKEDINIKSSNNKKLLENLLNIIEDSKNITNNIINNNNDNNDLNNNEIIIKSNKIMEIILSILNQDKENNIINNTNPILIKNIIDKCIYLQKINNSKNIIEILKIITSKNNIGDEIIEQILNFIIDNYNDDNNNENKLIELEIISNLSKYNSSLKKLLKSEKLFNKLKLEYNNTNNLIERNLYSNIFKNICKNTFNVDYLINNEINTIQMFLNEKILKDPIKTRDNISIDIINNEINCIIDIIKDNNNFKILEEKKIIDENKIKMIIDTYKDIDSKELIEKLIKIYDNIKKMNTNKQNENDIKNDDNLLNNNKKIINDNFQEHLNELKKLNKYDLKQDVITDDEFFYLLNEQINNNNRIVSSLNINENNKLLSILEQIFELLRKNYNEIKANLDENDKNIENNNNNFNEYRINIIKECFNQLKQLIFNPDNHKTIIEGGLISFTEKIIEDYKENESISSINNILLTLTENAKNILQYCSCNPSIISFIVESKIMNNIINEIINFNENPEILKSNLLINKIFLYDNIIFSNVCKNKNGLNVIFNKIDLNKFLSLGIKAENILFLETIINLIINYIKNNNDILNDNNYNTNENFFNDIFYIINKSLNIKDKTYLLLLSINKLISLIYIPKLYERIDKINIINYYIKDFDEFKSHKEYVISVIECLYIFINNKINNNNYNNNIINDMINTDFILKLKSHCMSQNLDVELIYHLSKLYLSLILNDNNISDIIEIFNEKGITNDIISFIDLLDSKLLPLTDKEKNIGGGLIGGMNITQIEAKNKEELINKMKKLNVDEIQMNAIENKINEAQSKNLDENTIRVKVVIKESYSQELPKEEKDNYDLIFDDNNKIDYVRSSMKNSINCLDKITISSKSNNYLYNKTNFIPTIINTIKNDNHNIPFLSIALHCLGNFFFNEEENLKKKTILNDLYEILKILHKKYYSNSDILTNINYISGSIIKNSSGSNNEFIKKFYDLISESIKCQDWNVNLILIALKLIHTGLTKNNFLIDEVFDDTCSNIFNLLALYKDNVDIQANCIKILSIFSKYSNIYSYSMVNSGILLNIRDCLNNEIFNQNKKSKTLIHNEVFNLLDNLSKDENNSKKISDDLMQNLLKQLNEEGYNEDSESNSIIKLLSILLKHKYSIQIFIQQKGLETLIQLLKDNITDVNLILILFKILTNIVEANDEYKIMLKNLDISKILNEIIKQVGIYDKKIEYQARSLNFLINSAKISLEEVNDEIDYNDIKVVNPIKPEIKNFLCSGKTLKIINNYGEVKKKQLIFSDDLLKVFAKKVNEKEPMKNKYIIETVNIKKVIKGHGTEAFKKSKGLFRSIPKPEVCFSIIGPTSIDGIKAINVQCDSEKDVDKWIKYIEIVVNYFKKTHTIQNDVQFKK